jgi:hypothetical protein
MLFIATLAWGQTITGSLSGTVTDATGKPVPAVKLSVVNSGTGLVEEKVTADKTGFYIFAALKPTTYILTVSKQGFTNWKMTGVAVASGSQKAINFRLTAGSGVHEAIYTAINSDAGEMDQKKVETAGMNGRNYQQMLRDVPGTVASTLDPFSMGLKISGHSINGVRGQAILTQVDGIQLLDPVQNASVLAIPSPASIGEVRILSSSYQAENPSLSGAFVNVLTKSGTRGFHGQTSEFIRNDAADAISDFAIQKEPLHFNNFGANIGGPVFIPGKFNAKREKLFFFASEYWRYVHVATTGLFIVPQVKIQPNGEVSLPSGTVDYVPGTSKTTKQSMGACVYTSPCVPAAYVSPNGMAQLSQYQFEKPNYNLAGDNYTYSGVGRLDNREDRYNIDWAISNRTALAGRYTHNLNNSFTAPWSQPGNGGYGVGMPAPSYIMSTSLTHEFSPKIINALSVAESMVHFYWTPQDLDYDRSTLGLTFPQLYNSNARANAPALQIQGYSGYVIGNADNRKTVLFQVDDNLSWVHGHHALKFGIHEQKTRTSEYDLANANPNGTAVYNTSNPNTTGSGLADAVTGNIYTFQQSSTVGHYDAMFYQTEMYVQDSWNASKNLNITFGLRYDIPENAYNPKGTESVFIPSLFNPLNAVQVSTKDGSLMPGVGNPLNGLASVNNGPTISGVPNIVPRGFAPTPITNFAPRFGFSWNPLENGKTTVSGGYGLFFMRPTLYMMQLAAVNAPFNYTETLNYTHIDNLNPNNESFPTGVYSFPARIKSDYTANYRLTVSQKLAKNTTLDVAYQGTEGRHLPFATNLNQYPVGTLAAGSANYCASAKLAPNACRPYMGYGDIDTVVYEGFTRYDALQTTLKGRLANGLTFGSAFSYSKTMENTSSPSTPTVLPENSYNPNADYSRSDLHRKYILSSNGGYSIPFFRKSSSKLLTNALGFWDVATVLNYQSGAPFNVCLPSDNMGIGTSSVTGITQPCERPNVTGDPNSMATRSVTKWFNAAAYSTPAAGTIGNAKRNMLTGPYYLFQSASLFKHFKPSEKSDLEFRVEGFNIWNHDSYSSLGTTFGTSTFGSVNGATPGRVLQASGTFKF